MPRLCTVCHHPDRGAIDKGVVSQAPIRQLASPTAIHALAGLVRVL